ncbi:hypothetical protein ACHAPW_002044 [Verticillium nonalfalfae]
MAPANHGGPFPAAIIRPGEPAARLPPETVTATGTATGQRATAEPAPHLGQLRARPVPRAAWPLAAAEDGSFTTETWENTTETWKITPQDWKITLEACEITPQTWKITSEAWEVTAEAWSIATKTRKVTAAYREIAAQNGALTVAPKV